MKVKDFPVSIIVAVCITAAALSALNAQAHQADDPISLEELKASAETDFAAADADADGALSGAEFEAIEADALPNWRRARGPAIRNARRGDGPMRQGRRGGPFNDEDVFAEADSNDDGQLSKEEYEARPEAMQRLARRAMFARLDDDEDGLLSFDEYPSRYARMAALDRNADGQVTSDEMAPRGPRHHGRHGRGPRGRR